MSVKNFIRKSIFKNELNYVFMGNKVSEFDQGKILSSIFENYLEISKQYILKEEITSIEDLKNNLSEIVKDDVVGAINSLFNVQDDLELPLELGSLFLKNEKIAVFVGAGVSKLLGFPLWDELANGAIKYLLDKNLITYFELQKIQKEILSPKQKMTIFHEIISKEMPESKDFYEDTFLKEKKLTRNPYEILLQFDWVKITSNIDNEFSDAYFATRRPLSVEAKNRLQGKIKTSTEIKKITSGFSDQTDIDFNSIYHIHGSLDNLNDTIVTTKDYVNAYYRQDGKLEGFLTRIFKEYNILFIGYGLDEFEVLERILDSPKTSLKRYVLLPVYLHELNFFRIKQKYFRNLLVEPIRYYLDFNGYDRLYDVLCSWLQQIKDKKSEDYYRTIEGFDEVL